MFPQVNATSNGGSDSAEDEENNFIAQNVVSSFFDHHPHYCGPGQGIILDSIPITATHSRYCCVAKLTGGLLVALICSFFLLESTYFVVYVTSRGAHKTLPGKLQSKSRRIPG